MKTKSLKLFKILKQQKVWFLKWINITLSQTEVKQVVGKEEK